jgi:hypothetical protein
MNLSYVDNIAIEYTGKSFAKAKFQFSFLGSEVTKRHHFFH